MSYLELKNLEKRYGKNSPLVVDHMNMSIEKGEFVVFLGPSGCGKTTTLRMIAGLEDVTAGDITLEGKSIINLTPRERGVSMIFQSYAVWPHLTVFDNIAYPLKLQKVSKDEIKKRVYEAAKVTQIENLLDRYPAQMSGGQRQRVAVSRAIVVDPKLFLMDEPLSNLDAKLRVSMRTDLRNIHNKLGATSIFVTHDQSEAMSLADRIFIMNNGKIEQVGTPDEVYHNSATKFVAGFIGTPPTNFFSVEVVQTQKGLSVCSDEINLSVPDKYKAGLAPYIGKNVDLGLRPEYIEAIKPSDDDSVFAKATVNFVEPQGSHSVLILDIGNHEIKIEASEFSKLKSGENVGLTIKDDRMAFFDRDTTKRII